MSEGAHQTAPSNKRRRVLRYLLPLVLIGPAVHVILPQITTLQHSLEVIKAMLWWAIALAVVTQVLGYLSSGYLLKVIAALEGQRMTIVRGTIISTAATSLGLAGGGPVGSVAATYRWMRGSGAGVEGATLAGWLPPLLYDGAELAIAIFGLIHLLVVHQLSSVQAVAFAAILMVLLLVFGVIVWGNRQRTRVSSLADRVACWWSDLRHRSCNPAATRPALDRWFGVFDSLGSGGWRGPALGCHCIWAR